MSKRGNNRKYYLSILIFLGIFVFVISPLIHNFIKEPLISLSPMTLTGKTEVVIIENQDNTNTLRHYIYVGALKYEIIDYPNYPLITEEIISGKDIEIFGDVNPVLKTISLSQSSYIRILSNDVNVASVNNRGNFNLGEQKTLVVPIYTSSGINLLPIEEINSKIFDFNNPNSLNSWLKEVSYNKVWLTGNVHSWIHANQGEIICDPDIRDSQLFRNNNINIEPYTRLIVIFEEGSCSTQFDGVANVGIPEFNLGDTKIWLSTSLLKDTSMLDNGVLFHEFGHNLGLYHAKALWCLDQIPFSVACSSNYNDPVEVMGSPGSKAHFNAIHKEKIGWFKEIQIVNYNPSRRNYTLQPIEYPNGTKMIKIPLMDGSFYSIEYRRPIGFDLNSLTDTQDPDGSIYRYGGARIILNKLENEGDSQLLDLTLSPNNGGPYGGGLFTAILPVSYTFTDPINHISITTLEVNENYLVINISGDIKCAPTDTFNQAENNCESNLNSLPEDSTLQKSMITSDFNDLRNSQTSDSIYKMSTALNTQSRIFPLSASSSYLYRSLLSFDTKLIPKNSVIQSSTLSIKPTFIYYFSTQSNNFITLVKADPSNPQSLTNSDFNKFNSEIIDSNNRIFLDQFIGQLIDFPLNSFGLTKINKTGFTSMGILTGRDYLGGSQSDNREDIMFSFLSSNHPQTSFHPNLKIIYTLSTGCGNGILDVNEECDDSGVNNNLDQCNNSCSFTYCGDSVIQTPNGLGIGGILNYGFEDCDDGNQIDNDYCSNNCILNNNPYTCLNKNKCEDYNSDLSSCYNDPCGFGDCYISEDLCKGPSCANGRLDLNEFCDGGSTLCYNQQGYLGTGQCNLQCTNTHICNPIQSCGDGQINGQEICDEGLSLNGEPLHCNSDCSGQTPAECGNGVIEAPEICDDGNTNNGDNCRNDCKNNICGDGYFNYLNEQCDDGNKINTDYCKNDCKINAVCASSTCTLKIPSISLDGFILAGTTSQGFDYLRTLPVGSSVNQYNLPLLMQLINKQTTTNNNQINRIILPFKTSLIPSTVNIQSAKVEIYTSVISASSSPPDVSSKNYLKLAKINLIDSPNFGVNDYNKLTTLSSISTPVSQGPGSVNNLQLNTPELSWINRGNDAWTVLGIRGGYDVEGIPSGINANLQVNFISGDQNISQYPTPQLVITFQTICGNNILESGEQCETGMTSTCLINGLQGNKNCSSTCQWNSCISPCGDGYCTASKGESCSTCHADCGQCPPNPRTCFAENTKILTLNGKINIQDIKIGDKVLSYNEKTKKIENSKVTQIFKHQVQSYLIINNKLKVTSEHPFLINNHWKEIGQASLGETLKTNNGMEIISSIKESKEDIDVYNLEVENNHNYFAEDYLVHNKGPIPPGSNII